MPPPEANEPEENEIDALRQAIARLTERHDQTDQRLDRIESVLRIMPASEAVPEAAPPPETLAPEAVRPEPVPPAPDHSPPIGPERIQNAATSPATPKLETQVGLTWINRVGAVTLIIGVGFFFKYAIDNRWIGETGRVSLGAIAGMMTLAVADHFWRRDQKTFAQGICGTGIAVLYLSFYASFAFYHLVPLAVAFLLLSLTTAVAGALALRYNSAAIAALGISGGYASPILLSAGEDRPWTFFSYLLLLNIGALSIAKTRAWRGLDWLAFCATCYLYASWYHVYFQTEKQIPATIFAVTCYLLFANGSQRLIFFASQFCVVLATLAIWEHNIAPYALLTLGLSLAGLAIADRRRWPNGALTVFAAFWFSYTAWRGAYPAHPLAPSLWLLSAAFLAFFCWLPWRWLGRNVEATRSDLVLLALNGSAYFAAAYTLLRVNYTAFAGLLSVALGSIHAAMAWALRQGDPEDGRRPDSALLSAGIAIGFFTLAVPIQFAGYRITIAWALEALALVWIGIRTETPRLIYIAMSVFLLVLFRLQLVDFWIYPSPYSHAPLGNARFATGVIAAISLWLAAWWTTAVWMRIYAYLSGHYAMLWVLCLETLDWAARTAPGSNLANVQTAAISILIAAYGVTLIIAGVASREGIHRLLGLALLGIVIAKLYLYDVWLLVRVYRVIAFAALGALLMFTSYLYSHYRAAIEAWWSTRKILTRHQR